MANYSILSIFGCQVYAYAYAYVNEGKQEPRNAALHIILIVANLKEYSLNCYEFKRIWTKLFRSKAYELNCSMVIWIETKLLYG